MFEGLIPKRFSRGQTIGIAFVSLWMGVTFHKEISETYSIYVDPYLIWLFVGGTLVIFGFLGYFTVSWLRHRRTLKRLERKDR